MKKISNCLPRRYCSFEEERKWKLELSIAEGTFRTNLGLRNTLKPNIHPSAQGIAKEEEE